MLVIRTKQGRRLSQAAVPDGLRDRVCSGQGSGVSAPPRLGGWRLGADERYGEVRLLLERADMPAGPASGRGKKLDVVARRESGNRGDGVDREVRACAGVDGRAEI